MSLLAQKMANSFPLKSTVRRDQSSMGQKIFSLFGDLIDSKLIDTVKLSNSFKLEKEDIEVGNVKAIKLKEEDEFREDEENDALYIFPKVYGYKNNQEFLLERVSNSEDFLYGLPYSIEKSKEINFTDNLAYTSRVNNPQGKVLNSEGFWIRENSFEINERLHITIKDSLLYKGEENPSSLQPFGGFTYILLKGKDKFYNDIEEYIKVKRDGEYRTSKIFRKLDSVEFDGFDGWIEIRISECNSGELENLVKKNEFKIAASSLKQGICELNISSEEIEFENQTETVYYLDIWVRFIIDESNVKQGGKAHESSYRSKITSILLVDSDLNLIIPVDFLISPVDSRVYLLDYMGRIYIMNIDLAAFEEKGQKRSKEITVVSKPTLQRIKYGLTNKVKCECIRNVDPIESWEVKAVSPSGEVYLLKYGYNAVLSKRVLEWLDSSQHTGEYRNKPLVSNERLATNQEKYSWKDFYYNITVDEIGQWDLYTTVYYKNVEIGFTHKTSFMSEYCQVLKEFETGLVAPEGLTLLENNEIGVWDGSNLHCYSLEFDCYIADPLNQRLLFRSDFDEIGVEYE